MSLFVIAIGHWLGQNERTELEQSPILRPVDSRVMDAISVVGQLNENAKPDRAFSNSFGKFVEQVVGAVAGGSSIVQMIVAGFWDCLLYTSPSPRDLSTSRMPSSA